MLKKEFLAEVSKIVGALVAGAIAGFTEAITDDPKHVVNHVIAGALLAVAALFVPAPQLKKALQTDKKD